MSLENLQGFLDNVFDIQAFDVCSAGGNFSSLNIFLTYNTEAGFQHAVELLNIDQMNRTALVYDPQSGVQRIISLDDVYDAYYVGN